MKSLLTVLVPLVFCLSLQAQSIVEDPAITRVMKSFEEYNRAYTEVRGWRIQIMSTTDRRMMEDSQSRFKRRYPEYDLMFEHQNPYYHLKTGAFLTQQDARPFLKKLQRDFPGAFMVSDEFEISEVLNYLE